MNIIANIQDFLYKFEIKSGIDSIWKSVQVCKLRNKKQINVLFVASFASQWKYSRLFKMMQGCSRFNPIILVVPMRHQEKSKDYFMMHEVLKNDGIQYIDFDKLSEKDRYIRKSLKPDIIFYNQPYYHMYDKRVDSHSFKDKLICHSFYSFMCYTYDWQYNLEFHNRAWKLFYISEENRKTSISIALNKGKNVEVVGYLSSDEFVNRKFADVWKPQSKIKKRVIWSPHLSIENNSALQQSNFINMASFMKNIAIKYSDKIQFSFKPHPSLKSHLYAFPGWGKEKTDEYYMFWTINDNCQLDNGPYFDLFLSSDAMINDSGSFTVEYLFTEKPAINCFRNMTTIANNMTDIGIDAINSQYSGNTEEEIINFLESVVLNGNDPKSMLRNIFYKKHLLPPGNCSVTENIYNSISTALKLQ